MARCTWLIALGLATGLSATAFQESELFAGHPQQEQLLAEFESARRAVAVGRFEEAVGHFTTIIEATEGHPVARLARAQARMQLGAFGEAAQDYKLLVDAYPDLLPPARALAEAYRRQGQLAEAIETYQLILERRPNDLVARWNLRLAYQEQRNYPGDLPPKYRITLSDEGVGTSPVTFTDVAPQLGVATLSRARGSAWGDYDSDGDADLIAVGTMDPHHLYRNDGDGVFTDVTSEAGLSAPLSGWASLFFDYDRDSDLDLLVTRDGWLGRRPNSLYRNNGDATFTDIADAAGVAGGEDSFTAALGDVDNDGWLDIYVANGVGQDEGAPNALYRNRGDGTFVNIALKAGVANSGRSIGCAFGDYDNDGWLDLLVVNMEGRNALYHNNGDGTFTDVTRQAGINAPRNGFVGFFLDYDNDGWLDLFATGWTASMEAVLQSATTGKPASESNRLALYHNNGDGTFTDVTPQAGLARTFGAMAAQYGDVDNDGNLDIYLGTGGPNFDTHEPNKLFWNAGNGTFLDITESAGVGNLGKGHGATFTDYDDDGDLDLYAPIGGAQRSDRQLNSFYRNNGTLHQWVKLRLIGTTSNLDAIGARVRVTTNLGTVHRHITGGTGFGSMNDPMMVIGLATATHIDEIHVRWPSGHVQEFRDLATAQVIEITEGEEVLRQSAR